MNLQSVETVWYLLAVLDRIAQILPLILMGVVFLLVLKIFGLNFRRENRPAHRFVHPLGTFLPRDQVGAEINRTVPPCAKVSTVHNQI